MFCEKPAGLSLADLDRAIDAVRATGVPLQVGFNRRFAPDWAAARAAHEVSDVLEAMWGYGDRTLRLSDAGRTPTSGARALARAALRASLSR